MRINTARPRFRAGDWVNVTDGPHVERIGRVMAAVEFPHRPARLYGLQRWMYSVVLDERVPVMLSEAYLRTTPDPATWLTFA